MSGARWTDAEIQFLNDNFKTMPCHEMARHLPGRTIRSVQHRFSILGLKRPLMGPGDKEGMLTVLNTWIEPYLLQNRTMALAKCDCGKTTILPLTRIQEGYQVSCGCWSGETPTVRNGGRSSKHGMSKHRLYIKYLSMISRCKYPSCINYHNYGGRGICVCEEWSNDFMAFYEWSISNGWRLGLTIDRIDPNGNYSPDNCRWATMREQGNNTRRNRQLCAFGETKTLAEWTRDSRCLARTGQCISDRIKLGWSVEKAISTPTRKIDRVCV